MAPKQMKKAVEKTEKTEVALAITPKIEELQMEWANNAKEILILCEKMNELQEHNAKLINKMVEYMNKNPTSEEIIIPAADKSADKSADKPAEKTTKTVKSKAKAVEEEDSETKPKTKAAPKSAAKKKETKVEVEPEAEAEEVEKPKEEKQVKKTTKTAPATPVKGKITAPSKGTPKPKSAEKEDGGKSIIEESSSEDTDIDSLSSVSSESDASGGEDD